MYYNSLCLSGGGVNGLQILGSISYLIKHNIINLKYINTFIGTSVGSIICFLLNLNYTINTIAQIVYEINLEKIQLEFDLDIFLNNLGIDNGNKIIIIIQTLLFNKLKVYDITFDELYRKTNKILKIIVVNYTDRLEEIFDYKSTPNLSIIRAIRMSISIPLIFTPIYFNNKIYIDGGIMNNFGINYCNLDKTIGICIENNNKNQNPQNIMDFLKGVLSIIYKNVTSKNWENHINVIILRTTMEMSDFNLAKETKLEILKNGYKQTKYHIKYNINNRLEFFAIKYINKIIYKSLYVNINSF
uniref:PNPLA domain-containing protein n=1 Tax=viral metagenome TaxID=1070528 RepID=A0A6C0J5F3_9ZZZZ